MKKLIIGLIIIGLVAGIGLVTMKRIKDLKEKTAQTNNTERIVPVLVQEITRTDLKETASFFGTVKAMNQIDVYTKVSGRVEELDVEAGEPVTEGDVLAVLEHSAIEAQIAQATAGLEAASAQLKQVEINSDNLKKELKRITALSKEGAVSESRKDQIETQYKASLAQADAIEAQTRQLTAVLEQANINRNEAHIQAPITGVVSQRYVDLGDMVTPQRPAFTVIQTAEVKITATIPETLLGRVNTKTPAEIKVDAYPGQAFEGMVSYIAPSVDPRTRNTEIEIKLSNKDNLLKAGMFCRIELVLDLKQGIIAVPKDMLLYEMADDGSTKNYVAYILRGNIAKKIPVQTGAYSRGLMEIKDGLMEGDKIITTVGPHIFDGCKVEVINKGITE